MYLEQILINMC